MPSRRLHAFYEPFWKRTEDSPHIAQGVVFGMLSAVSAVVLANSGTLRE